MTAHTIHVAGETARVVPSGQEGDAMPIQGYYTTKEAAEKLGLAHGTIRDAVRRGVIRVERLTPRQNLIPEAELERYAAEIKGGKGWQTRSAPWYQPNTSRAAYQREWRARKKTRQQDDAPAEQA